MKRILHRYLLIPVIDAMIRGLSHYRAKLDGFPEYVQVRRAEVVEKPKKKRKLNFPFGKGRNRV